MKPRRLPFLVYGGVSTAILFAASAAHAAEPATGASTEILRTTALLTFLAIVPTLLICMTSFTRIVIVLSMVRHGFGMPETPPNAVLISLALFLTIFTMQPTFSELADKALAPLVDGKITTQQAFRAGEKPMRAFMMQEVHGADIKTVYDIANTRPPAKPEDVGTFHLTLAFMLNELRVAFRIGFVILLPFLLIDLVVASILLALGMLMVPPSTISLPIKVLMFVLIDGWSLTLSGLAGSFR
jgi:flagellar biosynthetic protein FliP